MPFCPSLSVTKIYQNRGKHNVPPSAQIIVSFLLSFVLRKTAQLNWHTYEPLYIFVRSRHYLHDCISLGAIHLQDFIVPITICLHNSPLFGEIRLPPPFFLPCSPIFPFFYLSSWLFLFFQHKSLRRWCTRFINVCLVRCNPNLTMHQKRYEVYIN